MTEDELKYILHIADFYIKLGKYSYEELSDCPEDLLGFLLGGIT